MVINNNLLGPQAGEEEAFAIEALVFAVQVSLQKAMNRHGVTNKELAQRLGMSPGRVSQILSTKGPNLTLRTIARIQHALGEEFEFVEKSKTIPVTRKKTNQIATFKSVAANRGVVWRETQIANTNTIHRRNPIAA
jgi:transcriptional regulator with XRE-family HTH domain